MEEQPRTTDTEPASTTETIETRTEKTGFRTSAPAQDEGVHDQSEEAWGDQRDQGGATQDSSVGSKLANELDLGHHGDQADRDETE